MRWSQSKAEWLYPTGSRKHTHIYIYVMAISCVCISVCLSTQSEYIWAGAVIRSALWHGLWPRSYHTDLACRGHHRPGAVWSETEHLEAVAIPGGDHHTEIITNRMWDNRPTDYVEGQTGILETDRWNEEESNKRQHSQFDSKWRIPRRRVPC